MHIPDLLIPLGANFGLEALNLAQAGEVETPSWLGNSPLVTEVVSKSFSLLGAFVILVVGWIVALLVSSVVLSALKRTNIDNRIASWITGTEEGAKPPNVEKWAASAAFWIVMIFTLLAFFNALNLEVVSQPLQEFLGEISTFTPRLLSAAILAGVAWVLATVIKLSLTKGLEKFSLDDRLAKQLGDGEGNSPVPLNETLGNILYWLVLLFFLPVILDTLQLQGPLEPVQNLIDDLLSALPAIFKAGLIAVIGWLGARLVRMIVVGFLKSIGSDQFGAKFGLSDGGDRVEGDNISLSSLMGTVIYSLFLIFTAISALETLEIDAISAPAIAMLNQVLTAIPYVLQAVLILFLACGVARFTSQLVTKLLTEIGFNNVLTWIGLQADNLGTGEENTGEEAPESSPRGTKTPSEIVGIITGVAIIFFGAVAAVDALEFVALSEIIQELIEVGGRILYGVVVIGIGLYFATLAFRVINMSMSGSKQGKTLAQTARIALIVLSVAMGLEQMGIGIDIIKLAFGLVTGGLALGVAVAFGWGGKDVAGEQLRKWLDALSE
jgi:hypothetical protein